jgi:hypothetical protein
MTKDRSESRDSLKDTGTDAGTGRDTGTGTGTGTDTDAGTHSPDLKAQAAFLHQQGCRLCAGPPRETGGGRMPPDARTIAARRAAKDSLK